MTTKITQKTQVLNHIIRYGSITPKEAMEEYGIMRLAARVSNLRDDGYDIETVKRTGKTRLGRRMRYAAYRLRERTEKQ